MQVMMSKAWISKCTTSTLTLSFTGLASYELGQMPPELLRTVNSDNCAGTWEINSRYMYGHLVIPSYLPSIRWINPILVKRSRNVSYWSKSLWIWACVPRDPIGYRLTTYPTFDSHSYHDRCCNIWQYASVLCIRFLYWYFPVALAFSLRRWPSLQCKHFFLFSTSCNSNRSGRLYGGESLPRSFFSLWSLHTFSWNASGLVLLPEV